MVYRISLLLPKVLYMKLNKQLVTFCLAIIAVTTLIKVICAPQFNLSGFTGVMAVALFSGLKIKEKSQIFLLPLITLFISDVLIQILHAANLFPFEGLYRGQITNYALLMAITLIGLGLRNFKTAGVLASIVAAPTLFFLVSNYLVWATNGGLSYTKDFAGLMGSYQMGLPFYRNSLISTAVLLPGFMFLYDRMVNRSREFAYAEN